MYTPDFKEFSNKANSGNLIPVYKEILADMETPVSAYLKIKEGEYSFLLESIEGGEKWARYSFLGCDPMLVITSNGENTQISEKGKKSTLTGDPLTIVQDVMSRYKVVEDPELPRFFGGAVGYLSYDMIRFFEQMPQEDKKSLGMPDLLFMITDTILIFDNITHKIKVVSNAFIDDTSTPEEAYNSAIKKIDHFIDSLKINTEGQIGQLSETDETETDGSNFTRPEFEKAVLQAKEYISAGDAFQIVLSQRFEKNITTDPFNIYRALRVVNPSPYMYFFNMQGKVMLGSSPEILVRAEDGKVTVKPIAGTRKRGKSEAEDKALAADLTSDAKEVAEHIMLVDLGRNDIGRVCEIGSIEVEDLMYVEKFSHVIHMTTLVTGTLKQGKNCYDVLRATFPAGTVSGAPKIRAMEIIEELETTRRGPYAGAVGYIGFSGNIDTCINIRGLIVKDGVAYVQAGAGIVADSVPENEFVETQSKGRALLKAISLAHHLF